ncbi:phospholipase DDHD2-like [Hypomesus transpacificus]|uniref:phospholipase DDHD2-like n=1 Tax=Hypomesus transpacificus TaxID=137520 RepID=UPI001F0728C7|nr:phospholipase DDHD2-like [Hypomesus transpacificus]
MDGAAIIYEPVQHHWFYCQQADSEDSWIPFSVVDSQRLEEAFCHVKANCVDEGEQEEVIVATEGRRFDVRLKERRRHAAYWEQPPLEVRRCSWFHRGDKEASYVPYPEDISLILEDAYMISATLNDWQRRLQFPTGETVVLHDPKRMTHHPPDLTKSGRTSLSSSDQPRPRIVKRGLEDVIVDIPPGEPDKVDHLVIMVHGIGATCDLRMRGIIQCVNDFRSISLNLLSTHFKEAGQDIGRVEFLPINWHKVLHGDATGVDTDIQRITLPSISRLRKFSNSTVLDLFFYNSPTYCQTIANTVASEINRLHRLFVQRHPQFIGAVSLAGHSLGSLILFDLLTNQKKYTDEATKQSPVNSPIHSESFEDILRNEGLGEYVNTIKEKQMDVESLAMCSETDFKELGIPLGPRKKILYLMGKLQVTEQESRTGIVLPVSAALLCQEEGVSQAEALEIIQPQVPSTSTVDYKYCDVGIGQVSINYPELAFEPQAFFALGSPIGMFLTVRGLKRIDPNYSLPTCKSFYNIFHPFDPVAYRIEPMVLSPGQELPPMLIPHHKGRKRMHLEMKDNLTRVSSDLLASFGALRSVWQTLTQVPSTLLQLDQEEKTVSGPHDDSEDATAGSPVSLTDKNETRNTNVGMLNGGRRYDYVLQEKPFESFNEYLFAIQSHLCYWESPDTALLVLREIYEGAQKNQLNEHNSSL